MSEERKGQPIEKWNAEIGVPVIGSQMRGIEDMVEQNDNFFDGIINNLPEPEDRTGKEECAKESVLKKLKECVKIPDDDKEKPLHTLCPDRELC